jgi:hypothetical protein
MLISAPNLATCHFICPHLGSFSGCSVIALS